jgi:hypothetical protein
MVCCGLVAKCLDQFLQRACHLYILCDVVLEASGGVYLVRSSSDKNKQSTRMSAALFLNGNGARWRDTIVNMSFHTKLYSKLIN